MSSVRRRRSSSLTRAARERTGDVGEAEISDAVTRAVAAARCEWHSSVDLTGRPGPPTLPDPLALPVRACGAAFTTTPQ